MSREISPFLIDINTDTPLTDVIKVSKVFDSVDNEDSSFLTERYVFKYLHLRELGEEGSEEKLIDDITWFNTHIIKIFLDSLDDESFKIAQQKLEELD